jgi:hypothetical protein
MASVINLTTSSVVNEPPDVNHHVNGRVRTRRLLEGGA